MTRAEETLETVRGTVAAGVDESRDRAADMLERAGTAVRSGSRRASRATEKHGDRIGKGMERTAKELRPARRRGLLGYLRRHPMHALLLLGLITGVVAIAFIPRLARRAEDEYGDYEPLGPMP